MILMMFYGQQLWGAGGRAGEKDFELQASSVLVRDEKYFYGSI